MNTVTVPAHFDGKQILLDEPVELEPHARLIVTVLPKHHEERDSWARLSSQGLAQAYEATEQEYPLTLIKEANPEYEGR